MATQAHFFDNYWTSLNAAQINLTADTIKLMLLSAVPARSTPRYKSDIVGTEVAGTGYTAGGATIGSMAVSVTAGVNDVQTVGVGAASAGTITLGLSVPGLSISGTTTAIAFNATPTTVQAALLAIPNVPAGSITVTGSAPTWTVTFTGQLGAQPITVMTITPTGLTGGTASVTHTTTGAYPLFTITGANASWPGATLNAAAAALYDATPATDATRPLVGFVDFGGTLSPSNGTLSVTWNASGIGTVTDQ